MGINMSLFNDVEDDQKQPVPDVLPEDNDVGSKKKKRSKNKTAKRKKKTISWDD
jgi:hypothetical protein